MPGTAVPDLACQIEALIGITFVRAAEAYRIDEVGGDSMQRASRVGSSGAASTPQPSGLEQRRTGS